MERHNGGRVLRTDIDTDAQDRLVMAGRKAGADRMTAPDVFVAPSTLGPPDLLETAATVAEAADFVAEVLAAAVTIAAGQIAAAAAETVAVAAAVAVVVVVVAGQAGAQVSRKGYYRDSAFPAPSFPTWGALGLKQELEQQQTHDDEER